MPGLGTVINTAAILAGGILGMLFGKLIGKRLRDIMIAACGLSVIFIGAGGVFEKMLTIKDGALSSGGTLMIIVSMCAGGLVGELIGIEQATERFGEWLKSKSGSSGDDSFVSGFVSASVTVSVGAMAIIGAMNDALFGDISILAAKSILDGVMILAMTSSYGKGCIFSVIPVIVVQGFFTVTARLIQPLLNDAALANISLVGSILIFGIGINLVFGKKVRVANFLPALIVAAVWGVLA